MGVKEIFACLSLLLTTVLHAQFNATDSVEIGMSDSLEATIPQTWIVALPFESGDSEVENTWETSALVFNNPMAIQFYAGLRAGVDSLNEAGEQIQLVLVEHVESNNTYRVEQGGNILALNSESFMAWAQMLAGKDSTFKIIGPFRGQSSELLADLSWGIPIINPLSRSVNTVGRPYLIAAAPDRNAEIRQLARWAFHEKIADPTSQTVLLNDGAQNIELFMQAYLENWGDSSDIVLHPFSTDGTISRSIVGNKQTRIVSLSDKVLVTAKILNQLRSFPHERTELWVLGSLLTSTSLDANQLMRQPLVWAQIERLDYPSFQRLNRLLLSSTGCTPGRWEWLGLDMAFLCASMPYGKPVAFEGPKRVYSWSHSTDDGFVNTSALIYAYDKELGVIPMWLPWVDYVGKPEEVLEIGQEGMEQGLDSLNRELMEIQENIDQ
jgi:hypothetical protein